MERMQRSAMRGWVGVVLVQQVLLWSAGVEATGCFPAIFAFGDGQLDTGTMSGTFPTILAYDHPPYGQTYYGKPSGRYSDGRLVLDFLSEALGIGPVPSVLQPVTSDYSSGASWAGAYGTISSVSIGMTAGPGLFLNPFGINVQISQFTEFRDTTNGVISRQAKLARGQISDGGSKPSKQKKNRHALRELEEVDDLEGQPMAVNQTLLDLEAPTRRLPSGKYWSSGLYLIAGGAHDMMNHYNNNRTIEQAEGSFGKMLSLLSDAVRVLYRAGARNIIFFDVEPIGCQPWLLTRIPHTADDLDWKGCLIAYNNAVQNWNKLLKSQVADWRAGFEGLNAVYFSQYDVKIGLLTNSSAGFNSTNTACCGVAGTTYNVDLAVPCGPPVTDPVTNTTIAPTVCSNPNGHLYWDGIYTTEAGNRYVTQQLLSGKYFDVAFPELTENCALNPLS